VARRFLTDINLSGFSLIGALLNPVSADPSGLGAGDEGRVWLNTTTHKLMYWNGTTAIDVLARSNHTGTQLASTISDFMAQVVTARLDQLATPTADVAFGGRKITGLADGVAGSDGATYGQLLALINNRGFKDPVRAATTANIASLAGGAPNAIDGVTLAANDRVLVKDQTTGATNGIYTVTTLGTGANGTWTRATDADSSAELPPGSVVSVQEGTLSADKMFMLATNGPITLGTTSLTWSAYGASTGEIGVAGAGLTKTGSTYDVGAGNGISVAADAVAVDPAVVARKAGGTIPTSTSGIFTIAGSTVTVNHNLNTLQPDVVVQAGSTPVALNGYTPQVGEVLDVGWRASDANNVVLVLPAAPASNGYTVGIQG